MTRVLNQLHQFQTQLIENKLVVNNITGDNDVSELFIVSFINEIAIKYKIEEITEFKQAYKVKEALSEIVKSNPIAAELTEWTAFQFRLNRFYSLPKAKQDCVDIENVFKDLKDDEANITKLILLELYATATETLAKLDDKTKCPVCDSIFEGNLEQHISEKHKSLEELNKKKIDYIAKREVLIRKLELVLNKIAIIQSETSEKYYQHLLLFILM